MTGRAGTWAPVLALLGALAAAAPVAAPVAAEGTALEPLTRRDQLLGWEAVGRIDFDAGGGKAASARAR